MTIDVFVARVDIKKPQRPFILRVATNTSESSSRRRNLIIVVVTRGDGGGQMVMSN